MFVIETGSEAFKYLRDATSGHLSDDTYKISIDVRRDGIAVKINNRMWTTTLRTTKS